MANGNAEARDGVPEPEFELTILITKGMQRQLQERQSRGFHGRTIADVATRVLAEALDPVRNRPTGFL